MPTCKFTKKRLLHILHHVSWLYFLRIYLQKRLWKCASTISSRKYKRQVVLLVICSVMIPLSQLSSCWIWYLTFSWVQFFSNKLEFFVSYKKDYKNILLCVLICTFSQKPCCSPSWWYNFLFYFYICIKFILSTIISTMKKW